MSISERPSQSPASSSGGVAPGSFPNSPYWLIVGGGDESGPSGGSRNRRNRLLEVLSLDLADGGTEGGAEGKVLPVFGSEESAALFAQAFVQAYLRAWASNAAATDPREESLVSSERSEEEGERAWLPRGTGAGELISLLSGSAFSAGACADVERVALDPPSELIDGMKHGLTEGRVGELVSMSRGCFLERLMGRGRPWFENKVHGEEL